jgi:beta-aspartyl-peptidase (threonine type)
MCPVFDEMTAEEQVPLALAVHGGAWNVPDGDVATHREGVAAALTAGWDLLHRGDSALDVVEAVVRILEDDPTFNAGTGAHINQAREVELDASIMEGAGLGAGGVAAVQRVRNPVSLARAVLEDSPHVLLVGRGAQKFARDRGVKLCRNRDLLVGRELERFLRIREGDIGLVANEFDSEPQAVEFSTVGAVACDAAGHVAAATSTGGTQDKFPGRVGDTAIVGAGTYADDRGGAVSATGWGESILRVALAKSAADRMVKGMSPGRAGRAAIGTLDRINGKAGLILVDRRGGAAAIFNTPRMARGLATEKRGLLVGVDKNMHRP